MKTHDDIERGALAYATARDVLAALVTTLLDGIEALKKDQLPAIRHAVKRAAEREQALREIVDASPNLFLRPKTLVLHGIKVGYRKGKGRIAFNDAEQVLKLIDKKLPELADVLTRTTREPVKEALGQLTVEQLRAIGCTVTEAGDEVVVAAVDSEIDKLVNALVRKAAAEGEEA